MKRGRNERIEATRAYVAAGALEVSASYASDLLDELDETVAALAASQAHEARLRAALPDPAKLWSLAEWLEMKYPGDPNPEIQDDLRAWAKAIYATDPVKYGAYWVQAICDEEARAALAAAAEGKTDG